jgi:hypothetical protein
MSISFLRNGHCGFDVYWAPDLRTKSQTAEYNLSGIIFYRCYLVRWVSRNPETLGVGSHSAEELAILVETTPSI